MQDKSAAGSGFTLRVAASFNPVFRRVGSRLLRQLIPVRFLPV